MRSSKLFLLVVAVSATALGCHQSSSGQASAPSASPGPVVSGLPNGANLPNLSGSNVLAMTVNGSLCSSGSYLNKPCVSVTICSPGTTNCQTIDDILVDTGSYGLRVFKSVLTVPLTPVASAGRAGTIGECVNFGDGSSQWGPVESADVVLGTEPSVDVPIQVIDSTFFSGHYSCGTAPDTDPSEAGFNGILGVGLLAQDCGPDCVSSANNGMYFSCSGTTCTGASLALSQQVQNPVALLPKDNNGVILELPSIPLGGQLSVNGYLVLGIGTESNNVPSGVTSFLTDQNGDLETTFDGQNYTSFLDSGSNGYFFSAPASAQLSDCSFWNSGLTGWFCPASTENLSATTVSASGHTSGTYAFDIGNLLSLASTSNDVFIEIGATGGAGVFDWGLPFYLGRNVYVGIENRTSRLGTGPYWAY